MATFEKNTSPNSIQQPHTPTHTHKFLKQSRNELASTMISIRSKEKDQNR